MLAPCPPIANSLAFLLALGAIPASTFSGAGPFLATAIAARAPPTVFLLARPFPLTLGVAILNCCCATSTGATSAVAGATSAGAAASPKALDNPAKSLPTLSVTGSTGVTIANSAILAFYNKFKIIYSYYLD